MVDWWLACCVMIYDLALLYSCHLMDLNVCMGLWADVVRNRKLAKKRGKEEKKKNCFALFSRACKLIQIQVILKPTLPQEIEQRPMH